MKEKDILEIEKYFVNFSVSDFYDHVGEAEPCRGHYYHKEWDSFQLTIFKDGRVFQAGTEANIVGVELKTLEDLKIRFRSFTEEEYDELSEEIINHYKEVENE
jgi:hypothetical protein